MTRQKFIYHGRKKHLVSTESRCAWCKRPSTISWKDTKEGKEYKAKYIKKHCDIIKARARAYQRTEKWREYLRKYHQTEKWKAWRRRYYRKTGK